MKPVERVGLVAVILIGYALRTFRLDAQELRGDEAFGFFFSQNSYSGVITNTLSLKEPHPVASYWMQKLWMAVVGDSEYALRYIGVLFSVAALALLFRLVVETELPTRIAIITALLLAVSPYAIWHSQDARMYSMSLAFTLTAVLTAVIWLQRPRFRASIAYVFVSLLALHVHYFAVFIIAALNLFVLIQLLGKRISTASYVRWALMQIVLAGLYLPWLFYANTILSGYRGNGDSPGFIEAVTRALSVFAAGETVPALHRPLWAVVGLLLVALGLFSLARVKRHRPAAWLYGLYLLLPLLATWFGALSRPIFDERYLIAAVPPFYALAAASLLHVGVHEDTEPETLSRRGADWFAVFLVTILVVVSCYSLTQYYSNPVYSKSRGWRELAAKLDRLSACLPVDQVRLVQNYPDPTLWFYYTGPASHLVLPPAAANAKLSAAEVDSMVGAGVHWAIFVEQPSPAWDADGVGLSALHDAYNHLALDVSTNWPIHIFAMSTGQTIPLHETYANGAELTSYHLAPVNLVRGSVLDVELAWDLWDVQPSETYKGFVHLLDAAGEIVAQHDALLPSRETARSEQNPFAHYGILLPDDAPLGEYTVIAGLYEADAGGERLPLTNGADHIELGTVNVGSYDSANCAPSRTHE